MKIMRAGTESEKRAEKEFSFFMENLKSVASEFQILNGGEIKRHCGKGTYVKTIEALAELKKMGKNLKIRFPFIPFIEKEPKVVWPSEGRPGWIVINLAHIREPSVLIDLILQADKEIEEMNLAMELLRSK